MAVLNVDQTQWLTDDYQPWPLRRIAQAHGVDATVHDVGGLGRLGEEALVLSWRDLHRFLGDWSPHDIDIDIDIDIVDVPAPPLDVEALALAVNTVDHTTRLLPQLPAARVYYSGHDDCYLHAEATDPALPARLLTRLLALFAGSGLLGEHTRALTVPQPDPRVAADLLTVDSHWMGTIPGPPAGDKSQPRADPERQGVEAGRSHPYRAHRPRRPRPLPVDDPWQVRPE